MSQRRLAGKRPHKHGAYDIFSFVRGPQVRLAFTSFLPPSSSPVGLQGRETSVLRSFRSLFPGRIDFVAFFRRRR